MDVDAEDDNGLALMTKWRESMVRDRIDLMNNELTQYEHYVRAEQARQRLEKSVGEVQQYLVTTSVRFSTTSRLVEVAKHELGLQKAAHDGILACIPPQHRRARENAVLTAKLTSTPELLEEILLYLPSSDLLTAMQVCRLFNEAITASTRLQRKLGFREDAGPRVYFPTHDHFWFTELFCEAEAVEPEAGASEEARLRVHIDADMPAALKTIHAFTSCCAGPRFWRHRLGDDRPAAETITSETGITVGDILDATGRLKQAHRLCPDASPCDHNADGFVNAQVSFEATIAAAVDDPFYVRERQRMLEDKQKHRERIARQHRIDAYAVAKRTARDQGRPILTLTEFEAMSAAEGSSEPAA